MIDLARRRKYKRYLFSKPAVGVLVIIVLILANATWNAYEKKRFTGENLDNAEAELEKLQDRSRELKEKTEDLSTPEGVEEEIRRRFPVAKEGERVIILVDEKENASALSDEPVQGGSFWQRIKNWLQ